MIISYQVKLIKPYEAIYHYLLNEYNLLPNECVFLDDNMDCLVTAQKLGISTILINDEINLRTELRKLAINI
jgi:HAD superfamily hydrolase (TIGR01509 family)